MDDCFGWIFEWIKSLLKSSGFLHDDAAEGKQLVSGGGGVGRYGGVDIGNRSGAGEIEDDLTGESENMEPYREILERTAKQMIDVIPLLHSTFDQREVSNRPDVYANTLRSAGVMGETAQKQTKRSTASEDVKHAASTLRSALNSSAITQDEIKQTQKASLAISNALQAFKVEGDAAELITPLSVE